MKNVSTDELQVKFLPLKIFMSQTHVNIFFGFSIGTEAADIYQRRCWSKLTTYTFTDADEHRIHQL